MKLQYKVHNVSTSSVSTTGTVDGQDQWVHVEGLEVELTSADGRHGSLTLKFIGKDVAEAREKFKNDADVTLEV